MSFDVSGFGFRVLRNFFSVLGLESRVSGSGFQISGFGFRVSDLGLRVWGIWVSCVPRIEGWAKNAMIPMLDCPTFIELHVDL